MVGTYINGGTRNLLLTFQADIILITLFLVPFLLFLPPLSFSSLFAKIMEWIMKYLGPPLNKIMQKLKGENDDAEPDLDDLDIGIDDIAGDVLDAAVPRPTGLSQMGNSGCEDQQCLLCCTPSHPHSHVTLLLSLFFLRLFTNQMAVDLEVEPLLQCLLPLLDLKML